MKTMMSQAQPALHPMLQDDVQSEQSRDRDWQGQIEDQSLKRRHRSCTRRSENVESKDYANNRKRHIQLLRPVHLEISEEAEHLEKVKH